jgi:hypothetical protein
LDIIQSDAARTVGSVNETTLEAPPAPAEEAPLHSVLAKYQGDPLKLAEAYENLQREHGRQANEVGALRKEKIALLAEVAFWRREYPMTAAAITGRMRRPNERRDDA